MSVYYSATEKNKITSFVSNVDEPRVCHPREGSQKEKNTRYERMYLESRKMALIKLLAGQEERRRHREQTYGHSGEGENGMNGGSIIDIYTFSSVQFSSATQSCLTLCDPMDHSTPGRPVHHQLPEFTQTHVHQVDDGIQPSHPLSSPSPPALNLSQHQGLFQ